jgi:hypothetical protein
MDCAHVVTVEINLQDNEEELPFSEMTASYNTLGDNSFPLVEDIDSLSDVPDEHSARELVDRYSMSKDPLMRDVFSQLNSGQSGMESSYANGAPESLENYRRDSLLPSTIAMVRVCVICSCSNQHLYFDLVETSLINFFGSLSRFEVRKTIIELNQLKKRKK